MLNYYLKLDKNWMKYKTLSIIKVSIAHSTHKTEKQQSALNNCRFVCYTASAEFQISVWS